MHEALQYAKMDDGKVKCSLCNHRCLIAVGKTGICGVRRNERGTLYATTYSKISAEAVDPIEKKPLFHFLPGTRSYSLGSIGCNFHCEHCQNWHISRAEAEPGMLCTLYPEEGVSRAIRAECASISWTYNEPTIWHEYPLEMGQLARRRGLGTVYVTNGYITEEALREIFPMLNAYRVDIKSFSEEFYRKICGAKLEPVLASAELARELGIHVEVVSLIILGLNDAKEDVDKLILWIRDHLGEDTPVHFTGFHPDYHMLDRAATPLVLLEKIYARAKEIGLRYPYLGNVRNHPYENTYCPKCGALLIERQGFTSHIRNLDRSQCNSCGEQIPVILHVPKP